MTETNVCSRLWFEVAPRELIAVLVVFIGLAPLAAAATSPPVTCAKVDYTKARNDSAVLLRAGKYPEALATLKKAKQDCWAVLDETDRGWLISDLSFAAARAGQPGMCHQVIAEAPKGLDPASRVAKAIEFNRALCDGQAAGPGAVEGQGQAAGQELPLLVMPGLKIESAGEPSAALEKAWSESERLSEGKLPARAKRIIRRCSEIGDATADDIEVGSDNDYYVVVARWLQCRALARVSRGHPARVGYVRELLKMKDPGALLPAAMAIAVSSDEDDERKAAQRAGKSWREHAGKLHFRVDRPRGSLRVRGEDFHGYLEWWGAGDFNRDGFDDIIVFRSIGPDGGTAADVKAFMLTRKKPTGVLEIVETL